MILFIISCFTLLILLSVIGSRIFFRSIFRSCTSNASLKNKVVVLTGGNVGIGFEVAKDLAIRGAKLYLASHSSERGQAAAEKLIELTKNTKIVSKKCDLTDLACVSQFCDQVFKAESKLDVLICHAGGGSGRKKRLTKDGLEYTFQLNHFGHFVMVKRFIPLLMKSDQGRIIFTSSGAHRMGKLDIDNMIRFDNYTSHPWFAYCDIKLANVAFTKELSRRLCDTPITVNVLSPGVYLSNNMKNVKVLPIKIMLYIANFIYNRTAQESAQTIIYLAVSEEVKNVTGGYFSDCKLSSYNKLADDPKLCSKLWNVSQQIYETHSNLKHHVLSDQLSEHQI